MSTEPLIAADTTALHFIYLLASIFTLLVVAYLVQAERDRRLGAALREEYETRRRIGKIATSALELGHLHVQDLAWERTIKGSPYESDANRRSPPPVRPPRRLELVHSGTPTRRGSFDPDHAA